LVVLGRLVSDFIGELGVRGLVLLVGSTVLVHVALDGGIILQGLLNVTTGFGEVLSELGGVLSVLAHQALRISRGLNVCEVLLDIVELAAQRVHVCEGVGVRLLFVAQLRASLFKVVVERLLRGQVYTTEVVGELRHLLTRLIALVAVTVDGRIRILDEFRSGLNSRELLIRVVDDLLCELLRVSGL
jgi:hypothetical protein